MAIFPNLNNQAYDEPDRSLLVFMEKCYTDSLTINQAYWAEADTDTRFESGDQQVFADVYGNIPLYQRKQFSFNKIRPIIEMISGHQRRNRKSTTVIPVENGDAQTADQYTKIMYWINQQEGVLQTVSDAFHGALVTGMNFLHVWMDYREDPISGNIKVDCCNYNSFLVDPYFRKADLSDCNFIWKRSFVTKAEAMSLLPEHIDLIKGITPQEGTRDGKFQFMPEAYNFDVRGRMAYDEFYYRDYRKQVMVVDKESGESMEWNGTREGLDDFTAMYPQIETIESYIPTVNLGILLEGKVMYKGPQPSGLDCYPMVPVLGYYNPQLPYYYNRVQGVVRSLRDPQFLFNRFAINIADIIESQLNSGWIYKEDAVLNPKDLFQTGNGRIISLKEEAQMTDIQKIQPGDASQSMFQLTNLFSDLTMQVSGVNEELMGSAVDDKAGVLAMLRQGAGLTTLQRLFDQLDYSQKLLGKIMLRFVQNNFTPGKVSRIIEEEPAPQFYNKSFGRYDAAVEEGLNTTTQRQMQLAQFVQLREIGVPISDEDMIEATTVQGKQKIIENMQQQKQEAQQQKMMEMQAQMQLQEAQANVANATADANRGLAIERISRVDENQALAVERRAEALKDQDAALLDTVKALKEIQQLDLVSLEKLFALDGIMKQRNQQELAQQQLVQPKVDPLIYDQMLNHMQQMQKQQDQAPNVQPPQQGM